MDYPNIAVHARNGDGGGVTVTFQVTSGDVAVSEADVTAALTELLTAAPGVIWVSATRHYIAETLV